MGVAKKRISRSLFFIFYILLFEKKGDFMDKKYTVDTMLSDLRLIQGILSVEEI